MTGDRSIISVTQAEQDQEPVAPGVVQLHAEELSVTRETAETGRVRVHVATHERQEAVDVTLARERVEIEHVPIGRPVTAIPPIRHEGDMTIISIVEEVLVIERRLMLKEEIHVRRIRSTERHQETVTLRYQEASVTRTATAPVDGRPTQETIRPGAEPDRTAGSAGAQAAPQTLPSTSTPKQ